MVECWPIDKIKENRIFIFLTVYKGCLKVLPFDSPQFHFFHDLLNQKTPGKSF